MSEESFNPANGELIDFNDADSLIDNLAAINKSMSLHYAMADRIKAHLLSMVSWKDGATARVAGSRRVVKVVKPSPVWDDELLGEFAERFPKFAKKVLKPVQSYKIVHAELKKLMSTDGKVATEARLAIEKCRVPSASRPSFTIEE